MTTLLYVLYQDLYDLCLLRLLFTYYDMQKYIILITFLLFSLSCGNEKDTTPTATQMETITTAAGMLTRNLAYNQADSNWSEPPDQMQLKAIEELAKENTVIWPTFFRAASDTAMKLEQLDLQAARDSTLSEML